MLLGNQKENGEKDGQQLYGGGLLSRNVQSWDGIVGRQRGQ